MSRGSRSVVFVMGSIVPSGTRGPLASTRGLACSRPFVTARERMEATTRVAIGDDVDDRIQRGDHTESEGATMTTID